MALRHAGFTPALCDNAQLWVLARANVNPDDRDQVVLLGASRMQLDIDLDAWADTFDGRKPIQLAVAGSLFLPALDDLSRDDSFRGVAVSSAIDGTLSGRTHLSFPELQREYVHAYETRTAIAEPEQRLRMLVQQHGAFRLGALSPRALLKCLLDGKRPVPDDALTLAADRSSRWDSQRRTSAALSDLPRALLGEAEQVDRTIARLEEMVARIQSRGGDVVFLRLPSSGPTRQVENTEFPRAGEWDALANRTRAIAIHFEDYSELARYSCPDGSHLDYRDAPPFTRSVAALVKDKLRERGRDRSAPPP